MAVGKLSQALDLSVLPDGCVFRVIDLINEKHCDWYTYFSTSKHLPFEVGSGKRIIESIQSSTSIFDGGPGLISRLLFVVEGVHEGKSFEKKGCISFSSTNWPKFGRPDYSILVYQLEGSDALVISREITMVGPDPFFIGFKIVENNLVMAAELEHDLLNEILSDLVDGIIYLHKKALSWVWGKI